MVRDQPVCQNRPAPQDKLVTGSTRRLARREIEAALRSWTSIGFARQDLCVHRFRSAERNVAYMKTQEAVQESTQFQELGLTQPESSEPIPLHGGQMMQQTFHTGSELERSRIRSHAQSVEELQFESKYRQGRILLCDRDDIPGQQLKQFRNRSVRFGALL